MPWIVEPSSSGRRKQGRESSPFFRKVFPTFLDLPFRKLWSGLWECSKEGQMEDTGEEEGRRVWQSKLKRTHLASAHLAQRQGGAQMSTLSWLEAHCSERALPRLLQGLQQGLPPGWLDWQGHYMAREERDLVATGKQSILRTLIEGTTISVSPLPLAASQLEGIHNGPVP